MVTIANWRQGEEDDRDAFELLWLGAWYPVTFFGFGSPKEAGSYRSFLLKYPNTDQFKVWIPNKWTQLCLSYDKKSKYILMVKVGMDNM